jgi:hypothetical protein
MVNDDIYTALSAAIDWVDLICDTKLPDGYILPQGGTALVFSCVSETPETAIDGDIVFSESRWQVSVHSTDLGQARIAKAAVIAALHGYAGGSIVRCDFESAPGEIFQSDTIPFSYHIPIDFMIQH